MDAARAKRPSAVELLAQGGRAHRWADAGADPKGVDQEAEVGSSDQRPPTAPSEGASDQRPPAAPPAGASSQHQAPASATSDGARHQPPAPATGASIEHQPPAPSAGTIRHTEQPARTAIHDRQLAPRPATLIKESADRTFAETHQKRTFWLSTEEIRRLDKLAKETKRSRTELVSLGLRLLFDWAVSEGIKL